MDEGTCRLRLLHDYRAIDDDPRALAWIDTAVDRNSRAELAALKHNIEIAHARTDLVMSFEDSVRVRGARQDVYDFLAADAVQALYDKIRTLRDLPGLYEANHELILGLIGAQVHNAEDLEQLVVKTTPGGAPVHVSDVATVQPGVQPVYTVVTANGKPSVLLNITRDID